MDVIKHIMELCQERNWSYYRLAKESNIPYSTISNMIQRTNIPSVPTLEKICRGFDISVATFFDENSGQMHLTDAQLELLKDYEKLTQEERRLLEAYMSGLLKRI